MSKRGQVVDDIGPSPVQPTEHVRNMIEAEESQLLPTLERIAMKLFMLCGIVETKFANMITSPRSEKKFRFMIFIFAFLLFALAWTVFLVEFFVRKPSWKIIYLFLPGLLSSAIYFYTFLTTMKFIKYTLSLGRQQGWNEAREAPTYDPEFVYLWIIVVNMIPMVVAFIIAYIDHHNEVAETSSYAAALQCGLIFIANIISMFPHCGCTSSPVTEDV